MSTQPQSRAHDVTLYYECPVAMLLCVNSQSTYGLFLSPRRPAAAGLGLGLRGQTDEEAGQTELQLQHVLRRGRGLYFLTPRALAPLLYYCPNLNKLTRGEDSARPPTKLAVPTICHTKMTRIQVDFLVRPPREPV